MSNNDIALCAVCDCPLETEMVMDPENVRWHLDLAYEVLICDQCTQIPTYLSVVDFLEDIRNMYTTVPLKYYRRFILVELSTRLTS